MGKRTINLPDQLLAALEADANRLAISLPALITAELLRYRALADASVPRLTRWQWDCLAHVMFGVEGSTILSGTDNLPGPRVIISEIDTWAAGGTVEEIAQAGKLIEQVKTWPPLTIAGVLIRLRGR